MLYPSDSHFVRALTFSRIIIWGGGIFAPAVTGWFGALQRIPIQSKWPAALAKTGLDQFAFAPIAISGTSHLHFPFVILLPRLYSMEWTLWHGCRLENIVT
jgi:hypothetical protein